MNSKGRSSAAWWAQPQPVETGLSVDDRPNELNIAFWVISSVGAASPLLLHIIYVSVRAPSLSSPLSLFLSFHAPPHKHITISFSCTLCYILLFFSASLSLSLSLSLSPFHPFTASFFHPPSLLPAILSPGISLSSFRLSHSFSAFFLSLLPSVSLSCLYHSLPLLFYSLYLCLPLYPSLPQQLPVFFFFCLTLAEPFFSQAIFPFEPLFHSPPSHFLSLFPSLSFRSHAYSTVWSSIALC